MSAATATEIADVDAAAAALKRFLAALLPAAEDGLQQQNDGSWLGCRRADDLVIVVADAPERETAARLIGTCTKRREHDPTGSP